MKDIVIIIIVLIIIIAGGIMLQQYIKCTSNEMVDKLVELKNSINENGEINAEIKKQANKINDEWEELEEEWSIFVLHDELDLIETSIVSMKSNIEENVQDISIEEIDKSIFLLNHIYEKEKLCIKNIF